MKITIITGPTSRGKTALALEEARRLNAEIINCDSRQVYKHLDLISNKDLPAKAIFKNEKKLNGFDIGYYPYEGSKIWLYDIVDPKDYFSSFDFAQSAIYLLKNILKDKNVIIVGGTYFYLYHLLYDVESEKIKPDWELRQRLDSMTVQKMQIMLKELDPHVFESLNNSDKNNPRRLMRRIEIVKSGMTPKEKFRPGSVTLKKKLANEDIEIEFKGLRFKDSNILRGKIINKVNERIKKGAFEEVESLMKKGYTVKDPGMQSIGYKQLMQYFRGAYSKEQAIEDWINKEVQYAKRQYAFMKKDKNIEWKEV